MAREDLVALARAVVVPVVLELEGAARASAPSPMVPAEVRAVAVALVRAVLDELDPGVDVETVREVAGGRVVALVRSSPGLEASTAAHPSARART
jgi:hypothetical protein